MTTMTTSTAATAREHALAVLTQAYEVNDAAAISAAEARWAEARAADAADEDGM